MGKREYWADETKSMRKSIHGKKISRKQALKGLGDPKTWEKDKKRLMKEFRSKPPFILSLSKELYNLSIQMKKLGVKMDYYGGFGKIGEHGRELIGAATIARGWVNGIKKEKRKK